MEMERSRSFSNSWTDRPHPPRIATVKPVSKSFSEDDLLKAAEQGQDIPSPTRVFSRFKVQDLSLLKKDNIIGELEKCLEELESEHGYAQRLGDVYEKVECERNQLLDELDIAFQDLQQYMQRQKQIEDEKSTIEIDREELFKENEYLKAVLSNRNEILNNKLQEENRRHVERIKELETKNTQHLDEINELYEERQTLINSLLNLQSEEVEDVIRKSSRSSSLCSRESLDELDVSKNIQNVLGEMSDGNVDVESYMKALKEVQTENEELKEAFKRIRKERDTAEKEIDRLREEKDQIDQMFTEKLNEFTSLQEDRNEKNLSLSKLNLEKRTLQRQYDHMRENNRTLQAKLNLLNSETDGTHRHKDFSRSISAPFPKKKAENNGDETPSDHNDSSQEEKLNDVKEDEESDSQDIATSNLSVKLKELELQYNELNSSNKKLVEDLTKKEDMCFNLREKYEIESNEKNTLLEISEGFKKELNDLRSVSNTKYSDLAVEYDNVRNHNQQLQNTIEKIRLEKENIKSELNNYKCDVIEKIKQNLDALEKERVNLLSQKESLEMTVKVKQETELELKETCSKLLKQVDETNENNRRSKSSSDSEETNIIQRKYEGLQKDYDRMLQKCRQLEKSVADSSGLGDELKRLRDENEMLLQRYRSLEADYDANLKSSEDEKQQHSTLLLKFENKCQQYDIGRQQYDALESEQKELCDKYNKLIHENNMLNQKYEDLHRQHKQTCNKYDGLIKDNKNLVEKVNRCQCGKLDSLGTSKSSDKESSTKENIEFCVNVNKANSQIELKNLQNEKNNLQNERNDLVNEKHELEKKLFSLTQDINELIEYKRVTEINNANLENKQQFVEEEKDIFRAKYDRLCVEFEKITKEKAHFALTVETLRDENKRLNEAVRRQRLISSSSQDLTIQRLQDENESFQQQIDVLQSNATNAINENKRLLERINRSDENVAATIRSLKARKNELQLQVETLKHENDYLKKLPKTKEKKYKFGKSSGEKNSDLVVNESLRHAHAKMAELQLENDEVRKKLQEYEALLNEQHQALAHANDLAMQKNLEGSKMKRSLEKRMEKITKENNELRRIIFLLDDSNINNQSPKNSVSVDPPERQSSSEHSIVNITFSTDEVDQSVSEAEKTPKLISVATVSNPHTEHSFSSVSTVPESPRLATSRQVENDLSLQLRELLDLSKDMSHPEEDRSSHISEESVAPPVPPPPPNYGSSSSRRSYTNNEKHADETDDDPHDTIEQIVRQKLEHWV